jgi:hypothetical protein
MPEGVTLVEVETRGSATCAGGLCEQTTYTFVSAAPARTLCPEVVAAVEQWSGASLAPVEGSECALSGTSEGWRTSVGIYRPPDSAPPESRIVVTATYMG